jgi:hypothetical protein
LDVSVAEVTAAAVEMGVVVTVTVPSFPAPGPKDGVVVLLPMVAVPGMPKTAAVGPFFPAASKLKPLPDANTNGFPPIGAVAVAVDGLLLTTGRNVKGFPPTGAVAVAEDMDCTPKAKGFPPVAEEDPKEKLGFVEGVESEPGWKRFGANERVGAEVVTAVPGSLSALKRLGRLLVAGCSLKRLPPGADRLKGCDCPEVPAAWRETLGLSDELVTAVELAERPSKEAAARPLVVVEVVVRACLDAAPPNGPAVPCRTAVAPPNTAASELWFPGGNLEPGGSGCCCCNVGSEETFGTDADDAEERS